jgi:hypothetical protein
MKIQLLVIIPILLLLNFNIFSQDSLKLIPKKDYYRFSIGMDVFKFMTNLNAITKDKKLRKNCLTARFQMNKYFFVSGDYGFTKIRSDNNYIRETKGVYTQLGLGTSLPLDDKTYLSMGYNIGRSGFIKSETAIIKDDFWGDSATIKMFEYRGVKIYHELYMSSKFNVLDAEKIALFTELTARLRVGLSNPNPTNNKEMFPGYGVYNENWPFYMALNFKFGLEFL